MDKGELVELEIVGYAFEGKGIAKIHLDENLEDEKKYVFFIDRAYPGDIINAKITKLKRSYAEAEIVDIITPSPFRTVPKCSFFGVCGGCKAQDLSYEKQIEYKQEQVVDCFEHIGELSNFEVLPIQPSEREFFYRNKMEYSFAEKRWLTKDEMEIEEELDKVPFGLGLHIPGRYDKVLDINECFLQSEISNKILNYTRYFFTEKKAESYSTKTHTGYLRHLVIKQSRHTDGLMVNIVTASENDDLINEYTQSMLKEIPEITTVVNNINTKLSQVATGDFEKVFYGDGFIYDNIGKFKFRISANSFFQTNTLQAEKLYQAALDFADINENEVVYDLFCGAGTISIFAAPFAKEVIAFESVESAIEDANLNKQLNELNNIQFYQSDLNKSFLPLIEKNKIKKPDVIITDPPRSGMNPRTIDDMLELKPGKIVYISCKPSTQARDIQMLVKGGYILEKIKPVDMFPHTYHIENVAILKRK